MGLLERDRSLIASRPFRSPDHTITDIGLIDDGNLPYPSEVSLSYIGVLFLDEFQTFQYKVVIRKKPHKSALLVGLSCIWCSF